VNIDLAWTPRFQPDDYLYGERFAFWNPVLGEPAAPAEPRRAEEPRNGELALRLFRTVAGTEYALYGYTGRWKQPLGVERGGRTALPEAACLGRKRAHPTAQGPLQRRDGMVRLARRSRGDDPRTPNSELRLLVGYEQELVRNLTAGTQLYAERIQHHDRLLANSLDPERERDAVAHRRDAAPDVSRAAGHAYQLAVRVRVAERRGLLPAAVHLLAPRRPLAGLGRPESLRGARRAHLLRAAGGQQQRLGPAALLLLILARR
jgi:hypothetical protein